MFSQAYFGVFCLNIFVFTKDENNQYIHVCHDAVTFLSKKMYYLKTNSITKLFCKGLNFSRTPKTALGSISRIEETTQNSPSVQQKEFRN